MVARIGPPATTSREPGQARKGAAAAVDSGAGVWLVRAAAFLAACRQAAIISPHAVDTGFGKNARAEGEFMSYQVLARKWRPRSFAEMVGQEHVLRALINALDNDRVHHAFLFTGTRGVGKTTVARILAKSLNCEQGVSSRPCGECGACREIDEGRFVDLIEVDAASRTKVEDTRELLENVQYTPTRGRYKVYLIDEVHMLSNHSFNALLKTLEEPPPHVKFLLATTDPQKLPVTILSRCLQFSLKRLSLPQIAGHLEHLLGEEGIAFDETALQQLARAADGSMRDALSLLDQAIAFGGGAVRETDVAAMLGSLAGHHVMDLLQGLANRDAGALLATVAEVAEHTPDFDGLLAELISTLHRVAMAQFAPEAVDDLQGDREAVLELARRIPPEDVQLYYQIGLTGRRDLPLAPDARDGFEMTLLRMLCFVPDDAGMDASAAGQGEKPLGQAPARPTTPKPPAPASAAGSRGGRARAAMAAAGLSHQDKGRPRAVRAEGSGKSAATTGDAADEPEPARQPPPTRSDRVTSPAPAAGDDGQGKEVHGGEPLFDPARWRETVAGLELSGVSLQLASHCVMEACDESRVVLLLDPVAEHMLNDRSRQRLNEALERQAGRRVRLEIRVGQADRETPEQMRVRARNEMQKAALKALEDDPNVQAMREIFDARLRVETVEALEN